MTTETPMLSQIDEMFRTSNFVPVERVSITRKQWGQLKAEIRGKDSPDLLSIAKQRAALDAGAWHHVRYASEKADLLAETRTAIAKAEGK